MPFDSSGTFNRVTPGGWKADAAAGIKIRADRHDSEDDGFATGLSTCITKDGRTQPTANLPMNGKKLTGLGEPTGPQDAATKNYVDNFKSFTTGAIITGADLNGRIVFNSPTGANGLAWTGADLSWLARLGVSGVSQNRLVLNNNVDGTGTDAVAINEDGSIYSNSSVNCAGVNATGYIIGSSVVAVQASSGNVHFWFYGAGNVDRGVIYTDAAGGGAMNLRTGSGSNFSFAPNGEFLSPNNIHAGGAYLDTGGNIVGSVWTNLGYNDAYTAIVNRIDSQAAAFANNRVASLQYRKVSQGYSGAATSFTAPAGAVLNGYERDSGPQSGQLRGCYFVYLQVWDQVRGWVGFSG